MFQSLCIWLTKNSNTADTQRLYLKFKNIATDIYVQIELLGKTSTQGYLISMGAGAEAIQLFITCLLIESKKIIMKFICKCSHLDGNSEIF